MITYNKLVLLSAYHILLAIVIQICGHISSYYKAMNLLYLPHICFMFLFNSLMYSQQCSLLKGKVVGIIQKNWRDYVVTFPSKEESQSQGRNAQKILVIPLDYRIPKIRISTQQAEALQVIWQKCFSVLCSYKIMRVLYALMTFSLAKTWLKLLINS